jgi:hypothetical protein
MLTKYVGLKGSDHYYVTHKELTIIDGLVALDYKTNVWDRQDA